VHAYNRQKIENARRHGVGGLLIVREWNPIRPPMVPSGPRPAGDRPQLALASRILDVPTFIVNRETANEILKASGQTIEALRDSIDKTGRPASREIGGVEMTMTKAFRDRKVVETRNVVGLLEGSDPKLKNEVVAVTAHHDHVGTDRGRIYYGADDNASGVAGVLEIARAFARAEVRPRRSILFLVFEAEECGLLGAYHYAMNPSIPLDKTVAVLNMDMISRDEDSPTWDTKAADNRNGLNLIGTLYNPELRAVIERQNADTGLTLDYKTDREDRESWLARSDHFPFAAAGVPMVLFNTGEHPDYHTENDTWDRLNYEKMERIVRLIYLTAWDVANRDDRIPFVW
jgi:Zn-dependent M28 family amino/carboxypeptidase